MDALAQAIEIVGGVSVLAERIGISPSAPSMWKSRKRVPADYCPAIERLTDGAVRCEDLRPDVDWAYLRQSAAPTPEPTPAGEVA